MCPANHKLADALRVSACELYLMYRFDLLRGLCYSACGLLFVWAWSAPRGVSVGAVEPC